MYVAEQFAMNSDEALRQIDARGVGDLVTHGERQLPIAPDLDDSRLAAKLGPLPRTPLAEGIAETYRRFVALKNEGRLDLSDL